MFASVVILLLSASLMQCTFVRDTKVYVRLHILGTFSFFLFNDNFKSAPMEELVIQMAKVTFSVDVHQILEENNVK